MISKKSKIAIPAIPSHLFDVMIAEPKRVSDTIVSFSIVFVFSSLCRPNARYEAKYPASERHLKN